jgi:high frequency lysogenization protein
MAKNFNEITIALAGILQASALLNDIAHGRPYSPEAWQAMLGSILKLDASDVLSVYGGTQHLQYGLQLLQQILSKNQDKQKLIHVMRYTVASMQLEAKIRRRSQLLSKLAEAITQTQKQADFFHLDHPTVINKLADVYRDVLVDVDFTVKVIGKEKILGVAENFAKCRAMLLAALRSAVLWQQVGGSKWQLLFSRRKILRCVDTLLS